jgi:hypothetical protein
VCGQTGQAVNHVEQTGRQTKARQSAMWNRQTDRQIKATTTIHDAPCAIPWMVGRRPLVLLVASAAVPVAGRAVHE